MPHSTGPRGVSSFSLGTAVIFSLVLGRIATFGTGGLLKVAGLRATVALIAMLSKQ